MILFTGRGLFITISLMFLVSIIAVFVGALILRFGEKGILATVGSMDDGMSSAPEGLER